MSFCLHEEAISLYASSTDLSKYLVNHGVPESVSKIFTDNIVDGLSFCLLDEKDLTDMGVTQIGLRKRILFLSSIWRHQVKIKGCEKQLLRFIDGENSTVETLSSKISNHSDVHKFTGDDDSNYPIKNSFLNDDNFEVVEENSNSWRLFISALYFLFSTCVTSFVMVLAHERLPDISKYPPLPDLFLDNLPHISWGFAAAEWVGVILSIIWLTILIFHKYRLILLRRFFVLMGTVLLLRSVTMIITSLSVPGKHLADYCSPYVVQNQSERLKRVLHIWLGMANSNILHQPGMERAMTWFPLFSFMEYDIKSVVPNVFEIPFRYTKSCDKTDGDISSDKNGVNSFDNKTLNNNYEQTSHCIFHKDTESSSTPIFRNNSRVRQKKGEHC
ncbi:unnamed protein product [Trichobilharzia regenti]|nr:unnamed protein product [Trichobilharzia regenti]